MFDTNYNPDVLSCLANLSNDEVFTPPNLVNQILDMLPEDLWSNKNAKFLDPVSKSGVFLREIAKRLIKGLENDFPDIEERVDHILTNQLYGIAITELTSLLSRRSVYCSKYADGNYSIANSFETPNGNIRYNRIEHTWKNGKCIFCGASQENYDRDDSLETHAYEFIHTENPEELFNMRFDVIIGNPPYQLETGGSGKQAKPIYHLFIQQAKRLNPRFLSMITPARWFSGGMGLNEFRNEMLNDRCIKKLVDYKSSRDVFPGVDIAGGVCYFLRERDYQGDCEVRTILQDNFTIEDRRLNEFDIFIRDSRALNIIRKVKDKYTEFLNDLVTPIKPFGMPTNYPPKNNGVKCWFVQKIGMKYASPEDVKDPFNTLDKWKILVPKAPIAGQTDFSKPIRIYHSKNAFIAEPGECCTESYIVAGAFNSKDEALSYRSYLFTKVVRFLILQTVISQDINKKNFIYVPDLKKYEGHYTDEYLCKEFDITDEEWSYINSRILETGENDV